MQNSNNIIVDPNEAVNDEIVPPIAQLEAVQADNRGFMQRSIARIGEFCNNHIGTVTTGLSLTGLSIVSACEYYYPNVRTPELEPLFTNASQIYLAQRAVCTIGVLYGQATQHDIDRNRGIDNGFGVNLFGWR